MQIDGLLFFLGYAVVFAAVLVGVTWWDRRRRRTRHPLPENFKLLRMPGEYLWRPSHFVQKSLFWLDNWTRPAGFGVEFRRLELGGSSRPPLRCI